jgi:hypothetical protein
MRSSRPPAAVAARRWNRLDAVQRLAAAHPAQVDAERQRAGHVATAGRGAARPAPAISHGSAALAKTGRIRSA